MKLTKIMTKSYQSMLENMTDERLVEIENTIRKNINDSEMEETQYIIEQQELLNLLTLEKMSRPIFEDEYFHKESAI